MPLRVRVEHESVVWFGERFGVTFQRTLRVPDDGRQYPLPPSLGLFPVLRVEDYADAPAEWRERGGVFLPVYQHEALWLGFRSAEWKPNAVKVGVGGVNAVTGEPWRAPLAGGAQDYLVCPPQLWLDGIKGEAGHIRQFVAAPLGEGFTVESQVTGADTFGGMQVIVYEPRAGIFPDEPPPPKLVSPTGPMRGGLGGPRPRAQAAPARQGIAAGGSIRQKIYPDPYGLETWDEANRGELWIHLANTEQFRAATGREPPPSVVSPQVYTEYGLPWFDLYDEEAGDVSAGERVARVKSVAQIKAERGLPEDPADAPVEVAPGQVVRVAPREPPRARPREAEAKAGDDAAAERDEGRPRPEDPGGA